MNEQTSELKACPFCGELPAKGEANWTGIPKISCKNKGKWVDGKWRPELGCPVQPTTYHGTYLDAWYKGSIAEIKKQVIDRWNTRPTQSPIVQAADEMEKALSRVCGVLRCRYTKLPIQPNDGCHCTFCDEHASAQAALEQYAKAKGL
jgi:hypothetical protein